MDRGSSVTSPKRSPADSRVLDAVDTILRDYRATLPDPLLRAIAERIITALTLRVWGEGSEGPGLDVQTVRDRDGWVWERDGQTWTDRNHVRAWAEMSWPLVEVVLPARAGS